MSDFDFQKKIFKKFIHILYSTTPNSAAIYTFSHGCSWIKSCRD